MKQVKLVGILNMTPDSFSDGGQFVKTDVAVQRAEELFAEGAAIVDIGAESTNPKKTEAPLTPDEEWARLQPVLGKLLPVYPDHISVDTYHPETIAHVARAFGPNFIANDVTGMNNPAMRAVVAQYNVHCIISHLPAKFGVDIQAAHKDGSLDDIRQVRDELMARRQELIEAGVAPSKIILDPGIGFGKTAELNHNLLRFAEMVPPETDVMIGYSRKRFLGEHRFDLAPNLAAGRIAIASGAKYLRVHDVHGHRRLMLSA
jgi:dihydropteroate synthase